MLNVTIILCWHVSSKWPHSLGLHVIVLCTVNRESWAYELLTPKERGRGKNNRSELGGLSDAMLIDDVIG